MEITNAESDPLKRAAALSFLRDLISLIEDGRYDVTHYPSISSTFDGGMGRIVNGEMVVTDPSDGGVTYTFRFRDMAPQED